MKKITTSLELSAHLVHLKDQNQQLKIGFVPTMGALHAGHLTLINEAKAKSDLVVCSIFVNPTQFNNLEDLKKYPRSIDKDADLLGSAGCDVLFVPDEAEIYPKGFINDYEIDFNGLDQVMEGKFRPGHFKGVAMVVERLFSIVNPDVAFFGRKDFQQVAIINHMVRLRKLNVNVAVVETVRNEMGLALSSRNLRLSENEKVDALIIYETLSLAKKLWQQGLKINDIKQQLVQFFNSGKLDLEYLEIVDNITLNIPRQVDQNCTCCIAAYCGDIRLIDNISLD